MRPLRSADLIFLNGTRTLISSSSCHLLSVLKFSHKRARHTVHQEMSSNIFRGLNRNAISLINLTISRRIFVTNSVRLSFKLNDREFRAFNRLPRLSRRVRSINQEQHGELLHASRRRRVECRIIRLTTTKFRLPHVIRRLSLVGISHLREVDGLNRNVDKTRRLFERIHGR